jgi:ABC-type Fe3+/spermidine/putrescine transport system ATPase subunit
MLALCGISKAFAGAPVLQDVSLQVAQGEIVCLLGPSGCGKTTLLRVIAGLEGADRGEVCLDGVAMDGVAVHQRGLGFMFQEYALFPHKDVYGNVAFGLRMAGLPRVEVARRVEDALRQVGLHGLERRAVHELSGGERQRVALARSLAPRPRLLLLDEPLGSLDRALREQLMNELRQILKSMGLTALYVTHDQAEAFALGDRVAVMQAGHLEQVDRPEYLYRYPRSPFVARFLGMDNLLPGQAVDGAAGRVHTALGEFTLRDGPVVSDSLTLLLRPEATILNLRGAEKCEMTSRETPLAEENPNDIQAQVKRCSFRGAYYRLDVRHVSGIELAFEVQAGEGQTPRVGDQVMLAVHPQALPAK